MDSHNTAWVSAEHKIQYLADNWKKLAILDRAERIKDLIDNHETVLNVAWLAARIGVSHTAVHYHYRMNWLPEEQKSHLRNGKLLLKDAIPLARLAYDKATKENEKAEEEMVKDPAPAADMLSNVADLDCPEEFGFGSISELEAKQISLTAGGCSIGQGHTHIGALPKYEEPPKVEVPGFVPADMNAIRLAAQTAADLNGPGSFDAAYAAYREWISWYGEPQARPPAEERPDGLTKTIIINDLHCPYHDEKTLKTLITEHAHDTDRLVIAGDLATMCSFTSFPRFSAKYTPAQEFAETQRLLNLFNETFPEVILFEGNHDARFIKYLVRSRQIPPEILEYFNLLAPGFLKPLTIMCKELENIHVLDPIPLDEASFGFLYQFGDFVAGHAEIYSKIPNRAACNFGHWLKSFAEPNKLVGLHGPAGQEFRCTGQAHTHQQGVVFGDYALWNFELGCATRYEEYVGDPKMRSIRPMVKGFTVVYQDAQTGRTDMNRTRFIHTGDF